MLPEPTDGKWDTSPIGILIRGILRNIRADDGDDHDGDGDGHDGDDDEHNHDVVDDEDDDDDGDDS
eukprot:7002955-Karenia_brevis.AAC.1